MESVTEPRPFPASRQAFRSLKSPRNWSDKVTNYTIPTFNGEMTPTKTYTHRSQPIDYFQDMFSEQLILSISYNTNLYALHATDWTETNGAEISAFIGIVVMMGLSPQSDFELYWSTDPFFKNDEISKVMPLRRFKKILQYLHVNDNTTAAKYGEPNFDRLHKIRPMLTVLNQSFQENCVQSQKQCIDESMVKFKGRSVMKQYMPQKPIKRGYKIWARCDSHSGYLHEFDIYVGKDHSAPAPEEGLAYNVVTKICRNVPADTLITFDNFYTSVPLVQALYDRIIYSTGTIRSDRKGLSEEERNKRTRPKLKIGEFTFKHSNPLSYVKMDEYKRCPGIDYC
ncbi:unnamed protein product [Parnassius apollo]|uniref:(apollo) hypothetical protein n=1 Tax=Parnassius apollo TaxID=110799 RepID=A0A8S3W7M6_PARAO|nr:unnamed protein product [Parnassius apollo]